MTYPRQQAVVLTVVAAFVWLLAMYLRSPRPVDVRWPASACEPWMADTLPGIGPKRAAQAAAAIRRSDWEALPPRARAAAQRLFRSD